MSLQAPEQDKKARTGLQTEVVVTLKLVQVYVTDKKGQPPIDLKKEDFSVYDNGKEQVITEFEKHILRLPPSKREIQSERIQESAPPASRELMSRKFFLFFDFAFNNDKGILKSKQAALHFIDNELQPSDEVGVLSYSALKSLTLHEYLTTDHKKAREIVRAFGLKEILGRAEELGSLEAAEGPSSQIPSRITGFKYPSIGEDTNRILNFIYKMRDLAKALRYIPGQKHIVLFSSGIRYFFLYGTPGIAETGARLGHPLLRFEFEEMLKELSASNSTVYAFDTGILAHEPGQDPRVLGTQTLRVMSSLTGGKYLGNVNDYEKHLETVQNLTGCYYVLGYYIDEKWDGKHHEIEVKVNCRGCEVHAQKGYFNPKPFNEYSQLEKMLHLVDLALSERPLFQTPLRFHLKALPFSAKGESSLALFSKVDRERIREIFGQKVEVASVIFDKEDNIVKIDKEERDFSGLPESDIYCSSFLSLNPGEYKCRLIIRNLETGRGAVASASVVIPKPPDSGVQLYPLLFLKPENDAFYLKRPDAVYPFDITRYSPLLEGIERGTKNLWAVVRCAYSRIQEPEIRLSASFVRHLKDTNQELPVAVTVHGKYREGDNDIFLIELQIPDLRPGDYSLYLFANETKTQLTSRLDIPFTVE